ncbi:MAG TPA: 50S ribosomal protein L11 methyltransferase, partial [Solirubrobacteraceae bacterium]
TVQLALNGASHVHAIDRDERAVTNTLDNAFRNHVAESVSAEVADIFPWLPEERYEVVVANLPQTPIDPRSQLSSHRPTDYWGRGLVDHLIGKLPRALAPEGRAYVTLTSLLSRERTISLSAASGLDADVVAWELQELPDEYQAEGEHLTQIELGSDAYTLRVGEDLVLVTYVLEIRHATTRAASAPPPWTTKS